MKSLIKIITNTIVVIVLLILLLFGYNYYQKKNGKVGYIFNYATYAVNGDSMIPTIEDGDLLIIHKEKDYKKDDIITFVNSKKQIITHRIIEIDEDGKFITQGDNNKFTDTEHISIDKVYGKLKYDFTYYDEIVNFLYLYKWYLIIGFILLSIVGRLLL